MLLRFRGMMVNIAHFSESLTGKYAGSADPKRTRRRSLSHGGAGQRKPRPRGVHQGGAKFCGAIRASFGGALEQA